LNLSNKAKVALILGVLLVIAVILLVWLNNANKKQATEPDQTSTSEDIYAPDLTKTIAEESAEQALSPEAASSDQINYVSPAPGTSGTKVTARTPVSSVDANGVRTYEITVTPAPNAGPYDWTRKYSSMTVIDASQSQLANKTLCEISGLSDSWSNIFEKSACDFIDFFDQKILTGLASLTCDFTAGALEAQTGRSISYKFENGNCLIIDRQ
jgi:hypothetical protein